MVFSWKDENGKRQRSSQSTGLPVKGNKKRAESLLSSARSELEKSLASQTIPSEVLFADFMEEWLKEKRLEVARKELKLTTFSGYQSNVTTRIAPYFRKCGILLQKLEATDINDFYKEMQKTVKATTIVQYHHNICNALRAAKMFEVVAGVKCPKPDLFRGKFLKQSEAIKMFEAVRGHKLELGVILGAFYGLRRGEVVGLK